MSVRGASGEFYHNWCYRKERRVFEVYVQECRAGQERRDREEIEALRNEVSGMQLPHPTFPSPSLPSLRSISCRLTWAPVRSGGELL